MTLDSIPFFVPEIGEAEIEEVVAVLRSGWLTTGPRAEQFEQEFAAAVGAKYAVALNSATAALHLALDAVGVGPGDEVIVPTLTFAATAEVVIHLGAKPVLVDCLTDALTIDPDQVRAAITPQTKAIMPVHYGGLPCQMESLLALAAEHDLKIIEDAAHALPAQYGNKMIGAIGDLTAFSFYANKTITTGEGGMLTTDNEAYADRARMMSLHGLSKDAWRRFATGAPWQYEIFQPGYKYNLTDIAAAIGIHQLRRAAEFQQARARCAARYNELLADLPALTLPTMPPADVSSAHHLYVVRVHSDQLTIDRNAIIAKLNAAGIGTSVHWLPLHIHPYYQQTYGYAPTDFPAAHAAFEEILSLPIYPGLTEAQQERVAITLQEILQAHLK